jgi:hypothetical protein
MTAKRDLRRIRLSSLRGILEHMAKSIALMQQLVHRLEAMETKPKQKKC